MLSISEAKTLKIPFLSFIRYTITFLGREDLEAKHNVTATAMHLTINGLI